MGLVEVTKTRKVSPALALGLKDGLALDKRFTPRRVSFHAQLRAELKLCCNDLDGALDDLRVADLNGLLDLLWLDRCPLMDLLRGHPEMIKIRESTANRADRVIRVLDP